MLLVGYEYFLYIKSETISVTDRVRVYHLGYEHHIKRKVIPATDFSFFLKYEHHLHIKSEALLLIGPGGMCFL
jgi:hypothetical protein